MGVSSDGILAYGYDLGGGDGEWKIVEVGEYGQWTPEWFDPEDEESDGLLDAAETHLLASVGFTETDWQSDGFFERKKAAEERLGVELVSYCSGDYPMYVLAAHHITVARGSVKVIEMDDLARQCEEADWREKLRHALGALGITPVHESPCWLLVSYMG